MMKPKGQEGDVSDEQANGRYCHLHGWETVADHCSLKIDKGPPCTCRSVAVIDEKRHAADCLRRQWTEERDAR